MQTLQELQTDFKAEVIATSLLDKNQNIGKIIIDRLGLRQRSHTKDLFEIYEKFGLINSNDQIIIKSYRQSIYDAMPENLFHPPTLGGIGKSADEIVAEIQLQRKQEFDARKFFKPFEQESSYIEIQSLLIELMYEQKSTFDNLLNLFKQSWPILKHLPHATALSFIYILPILHEVRGNKSWIERCLTFITGFKIKIIENNNTNCINKKLPVFTTGTSKLGINSSFNGNLYDGIGGWNIHVGPVPCASIKDILPHTSFRQLLQLLSDYFLPSAIFTNYIIYSEKEKATILINEKTNVYLGYSFFL